MMKKGLKVALIFDWMTARGGMERVNISLAEMFPDAEIFTLVIDEKNFPEFKNRKIHTSFLQKLPYAIRKKHQLLLPFFPKAFASFDMSQFDLIISSASSGFAKSVRKTREDQTHVCYCHTPIRFLYHAREEYLETYPLPAFLKPVKWALPKLLDWLTLKDQRAAQEVDYFIGNSEFVRKRIKKYYHKEAAVIYPGVDTKSFQTTNFSSSPSAQYSSSLRVEDQLLTTKTYFLALGRFIPYKKFDLLVKVFAKNGLPLKLAGKGPELEKCKQLAQELGAKNIEFLGFIPDSDLPKLYANARAFLFPAEEDFGITPIEAMASGTPVIYYDKGGASESVNKWGIPFREQTEESLGKAIEDFIAQEKDLNPEKLVARAKEFDDSVFQQKLWDFLENKLQ